MTLHTFCHLSTRTLRAVQPFGILLIAALNLASSPVAAGTEYECVPYLDMEASISADPGNTINLCQGVSLLVNAQDYDAEYIKSPWQLHRIYQNSDFHYSWTVPSGVTNPGDQSWLSFNPTATGRYHFVVLVTDVGTCTEAIDESVEVDIWINVEGCDWSAGDQNSEEDTIQCVITKPHNLDNVAPGQTITVSCNATDDDIKNCGSAERVAETKFQYTWTCFTGHFENGLGTYVTTSSRVKWTAPSSGYDDVSVDVADMSEVAAPDCGARDDTFDGGDSIHLLVQVPSPASTNNDQEPPWWPVPTYPSCGAGGGGGSPGGSCGGGGCGGGPGATSIGGGPSPFGPGWLDPVNLANGTEDYGSVPDISAYNPHGPGVGYTRRFNSSRAGAGYASPGLSPGWTDNYDIKLARPNPNTTWNDIRITYQNGSHEDWTPVLDGQQPTGAFIPPTGSDYLVSGSPSSTPGRWNSITTTDKSQTQWVWTPKSGDPETYLLSSIIDRTGHSISITRVTGSPDKIDHVSNDQSTVLLQFYYNSSGYLEQVKSAVGLDADMPSVFYNFGIDYGSGLSTVCLLQSSVVCVYDDVNRPVTSIPNSLTRYSYGYCARNGQPYLHSTTVLDPANTTPTLSSTAYINYNTSGKVTSLVDANGNQTVFTYDYWDVHAQEYGTLVEVKDGQNNVVQRWVQRFDRSNHNVPTGITDGAGNATNVAYGDTGNPSKPTAVTDAEGHTTQYTYDSHGNLLTSTNPCGLVTSYSYSTNDFALGRLTSVQEGTNLAQPKVATTYTYNSTTGLLLTVTTPPPYGSGGENSITEYTYDSLGNVLTSTAGKYLLNGNVYSTNAIVTTYNYTTDGQYTQPAAKGQPLTVTVGNTGTNVVTHYRYDGRGNTTSTWDALGNTTTTAYNLANNVTQVTEPATGDTGTGHVHTVSNYIYTGGPVYRTDLYDEGNNSSPVRQVTYTYGHEGEQLSTSGSTEPVTYTYDAAYHRITLADGNSAVTHYDYDVDTARLLQTRYPNPNNAAAPYDRTAYNYTPAGHVESRTDGNGLVTLYTYNSCAYVTNIKYNGHAAQNVSIEYDDYNRRTSMTDATGSTAYTYDDLNNLATVTTDFTNGPQDKEVSYTYWPNGSRKTMVTPAGTFSYAYDAVGRLNELENAYGETTTWSYLDNGLLNTQQLDNGAFTQYTYNERGLPGGLYNENASADIYGDFTGPNNRQYFQYDASGNRTAFSVSGSFTDSVTHPGSLTYTYTNKNELSHETSTRVGGTLNQGFAYDSAGNPTTLRGASGIPYNSNNQRTGSQTYAYDGNGNPTTYKGTTLTYDAENRMTAYGTAMTAGYNGDGLRAWKTSGGTTTFYLYDEGVLLCELNSSGTVTATNTMGPNGLVSRRVGSTSTFYVYDPQGSVAQRLDDSGNVLSSDLYDAYGNRISGSTTDPVGYNGQSGYYTDTETGLILCTYRYYDPANSRWVTRDPIGYAGGVNLYGYVEGNPANALDSSGMTAYRITKNPLGPLYTHSYILFEKECCSNKSWGFMADFFNKNLLEQAVAPFGPKGSIGPDDDDPSGRYSKEILSSNPIVEKALCECIQASLKKPPSYFFPIYACGSWVDDMYECAIRKVYGPPEPRPSVPVMPRDFRYQR